jgi:pimeloyl-ACP methyl ester carboxylesterase
MRESQRGYHLPPRVSQRLSPMAPLITRQGEKPRNFLGGVSEGHHPCFRHEPHLAACVVNYGPLPTSAGDIQKINARVLGIFGSLDRGIPPSKVQAFERCMNSAGKRVDIEIYDGAGHAFETRPTKGVIDRRPRRSPGSRSLSSSNKQMVQHPLSYRSFHKAK